MESDFFLWKTLKNRAMIDEKQNGQSWSERKKA